MKRKAILVLILALSLCLCLFPVATSADFGDFSGDSDYGSDWSSSDWSSDSSSWDSGSSWSSSDSYSTSSDGDSDAGFLPTVIVFAVIVLIGVVMSRSKTKNKSVPEGATRTAQESLRPMNEYVQLDPKFDATAFGEKLGNLYVQMQNCWQAKNIESVRPYFTDALYQQMDRQLDALRRNGYTNYVERISVLGVNLRGFRQSDGEDHIIAELRTRIVDYTLNDKTGELVKGDKKKEKFLTYEWELTRASGRTTGAAEEMTVVNCPNCGAPLSINATAKCPYCDSVVTVDAHDWAISAIRGIVQRTV